MEKAAMKGRRVFLVGLSAGLSVLALLALSPAQNRAAGGGFDYNELRSVPEKARLRTNPREGDAQAVLVGRKLFRQHCAECHGAAAEGSRKAPSLRVEEVRQAAPGALFWVLTNGVVRRGMPVWSKLPEPQRWNIVSYIQSLTPAPEAAAPAGGAGPP